METNDTNKKIRLHHANIIIGREGCHEFVFDILSSCLDFDTKANPDFLLLERDFLGIDDARDLERWVIGRPLSGEVKASLLVIKSITHEAQNALLKVLEEPPVGTYIFINLESLGGLLPTFLSRVRVLDISSRGTLWDRGSSRVPLDNYAQNFLTSNIKEKFALTRSLAKNKYKSPMKELIKNLEEVAYKNYAKDFSKDTDKTKAMKNILTAKIFASTRGSSPKMLLEWLSCVL